MFISFPMAVRQYQVKIIMGEQIQYYMIKLEYTKSHKIHKN